VDFGAGEAALEFLIHHAGAIQNDTNKRLTPMYQERHGRDL
jgi:hypothetical protein